MGAIEALVLALDSIPPIPGDAIVQCVAGLAVAVFRVYKQKCANDAKVGELHRAIAQVSVVLDKHLVPQRKMVATYRDQLKDLTDALKAVGEWVVAYARRSAMSKYFSANEERRQAEAKRGAVTSALQALNLAMLSVSSGQIRDVHAEIRDVHAAVVGGAAPAAATGNGLADAMQVPVAERLALVPTDAYLKSIAVRSSDGKKEVIHSGGHRNNEHVTTVGRLIKEAKSNVLNQLKQLPRAAYNFFHHGMLHPLAGFRTQIPEGIQVMNEARVGKINYRVVATARSLNYYNVKWGARIDLVVTAKRDGSTAAWTVLPTTGAWHTTEVRPFRSRTFTQG